MRNSLLKLMNIAALAGFVFATNAFASEKQGPLFDLVQAQIVGNDTVALELEGTQPRSCPALVAPAAYQVNNAAQTIHLVYAIKPAKDGVVLCQSFDVDTSRVQLDLLNQSYRLYVNNVEAARVIRDENGVAFQKVDGSLR